MCTYVGQKGDKGLDGTDGDAGPTGPNGKRGITDYLLMCIRLECST